MKKSVKVFVIILVGLVGFTSQAQIFGVKGGIGISGISSDTQRWSNNFGRTFAFNVGGTFEYDITDEFYLTTGLSFFKKGAAQASTDNANLFYINLPIGAKYHIFEIGDAGEFYVASGFYLGVLVSANQGSTKLPIGNNNGDILKPLDFGLSIGSGVLLDDRFDVGLSVDAGLADIASNDNFKWGNVAIMVNFGYKFGM